MILYPTETIYALGVNGFDESELKKLSEFKGRDESKFTSLMVPNIEEVEKYAELSPRARRVAEAFMPGSITLVLPARADIPQAPVAPDGTIRFRIPADEVALELARKYRDESVATGKPFALTCTSANVSGLPTENTPEEILKQFGEKAGGIEEVADDGPREGLPSTVVRVIDDEVTIHREGAVPAEEILKV